ncbi:deaminase domain-containing protein [Sutcliffiella sp. NPDC057660]|uniref:deaminase domain-containing protein n=1 Tax=Sutcliffiella sp. NPDC057660 TaxID=3346199 RepID=UPI00369FDBB2
MTNACERQQYKNSFNGRLLKRQLDQWFSIIDDFKSKNFIGTSNPFYRRLNIGNFAVALLQYKDNKNAQQLKYFYSHSYINTPQRKASFQLFINRAQSNSYDITSIQDIHNNMVVKVPPLIFSYVKVDVFRSIETPASKDRFNDTESMILENILDFVLSNNITNFYVDLFTYLEPCLCCDKNIISFLKKAPTCGMTLYYEKPYNKLI